MASWHGRYSRGPTGILCPSRQEGRQDTEGVANDACVEAINSVLGIMQGTFPNVNHVTIPSAYQQLHGAVFTSLHGAMQKPLTWLHLE